MRWVEGHISHCSRLLRRCHPEQSSCSGEFGCRSLMKKLGLNSSFSTCRVKKLVYFYQQQFGWSSLNFSISDSVLETKNLQAKVLNSTYRTIEVVEDSNVHDWPCFLFADAMTVLIVDFEMAFCAARSRWKQIILLMFFSSIFILLRDSRKIHSLTHEFGVKLYLKTVIVLIASRYRFSRAI